MAKLSDRQRVILARLLAGWRLQFRDVSSAWWYDLQNNPCGPCDLRSVNGLWCRGLIETRKAPKEPGGVAYFVLTDKGRQAAKETTPV
jgi:hypothetical protein